MATDVILLNYDFTIINNISIKKAVKLLVKGKASIIQDCGVIIYEHVKKGIKFLKPKVIRMLYQIQAITKTKMAFSKRAIFVRDKHTCQYCSKKPSKLTIDHVIPKARGGKTTFDNCVAACLNCNTTKNDRTPEEAGMKLLKHPYHPTVIDFLIMKYGKYDFSGDENWG